MQQYCIVDENLKVLPEEVEESDCIVGYSDRFVITLTLFIIN